MNSNQIYMQLAIKKAWEYQILTYPNPTVGALILQNNEILALEAHQKVGTSHAEILALLVAYEKISKKKIDFNRFDAHKAHEFILSLPKYFFSETIIYITLEPCSHIGKTPSCAILLSHIRPKKIFIATRDPIKNHTGGIELLKQEGVRVEFGICQKEALKLLEPFLIWQKRAFVLFKIAQTSNGKIGGGYLSSRESLTHVHKLRAVATKMVIGGNTVRVDRPTLDCRFTGDEPPDIIIFSKRNDFDKKNIPLFQIKNRRVKITKKISDIKLDIPSLILIEGGEGMLKEMKNRIDWILQYQTPRYSEHRSSYNVSLDLQFLFSEIKERDMRVWYNISGKL